MTEGGEGDRNERDALQWERESEKEMTELPIERHHHRSAVHLLIHNSQVFCQSAAATEEDTGGIKEEEMTAVRCFYAADHQMKSV